MTPRRDSSASRMEKTLSRQIAVDPVRRGLSDNTFQLLILYNIYKIQAKHMCGEYFYPRTQHLTCFGSRIYIPTMKSTFQHQEFATLQVETILSVIHHINFGLF